VRATPDGSGSEERVTRNGEGSSVDKLQTARTGDDAEHQRGRGRHADRRPPPRRVRSGFFRSPVALERTLHRETYVADITYPPFRILFQATLEIHQKRRRHVGRKGLPLRLRLHDLGERERNVFGVERPLPRERFVQATRERPHVGALVELLATRLFGAHIRGGPHDDAESRAASKGR